MFQEILIGFTGGFPEAKMFIMPAPHATFLVIKLGMGILIPDRFCLPSIEISYFMGDEVLLNV